MANNSPAVANADSEHFYRLLKYGSSNELGKYIDSITNIDERNNHLKEFEWYIKSSATEYDILLYEGKARTAENIICKTNDKDFQKAATDALNYILFDDFHETMKGGENHLDIRINIARGLFKSSQIFVKAIGANALAEYAKSSDMSNVHRSYYGAELLKNGFMDLGIDVFKSIIKDSERYDPNAIRYFNGYYNPRNTEDVKLWVDAIFKIASDLDIRLEARQHISDHLHTYLELYSKEKGVFDVCRNNKVCIKEISDSLDYVNNCLVSLSEPVDSAVN